MPTTSTTRRDHRKVGSGCRLQSNQRRQLNWDRAAYRRRNLVERLINRLKQFRRIATRYEKRAANYLAMVHIGMLLLWL
ncbi:MAG TPA: transposase [Pseudomonas sp.]